MEKSKAEPIFTEDDIALFKMDHNRYNLTIQQLKPVVLEHIAKKGETTNIGTGNINVTTERVISISTVPELFQYMENKLAAYKRTLDERAVKSFIQE